MKLADRIRHQRVKHIISSYCLGGHEPKAGDRYLQTLLAAYPSYLVELAITEVLVENWLHLPLPRGCDFLALVEQRLQLWENADTDGSEPLNRISPLTLDQFQLITGLALTPMLGANLPA